MNVLSLCSGIGGFDYGLRQAIPQARTICYVELDPFCQEILLRRQDDGWLDRAPLWPDLRTFDGRLWRGVVDCVASGFPCQPFSYAGKRQGDADARNLWPDVRRIIGESEPAVVLLENVPGALPYFYHVVLPELSSLGYVVETVLVAAAEVGAPHRRQRFFILAYRHLARWPETGLGCDFYTGCESEARSGSVDDPDGPRLEGRGKSIEECSNELPTWPPGPDWDRWADILEQWPDLAPAVADTNAIDVQQTATGWTDEARGTTSARRSVSDDEQCQVTPQSLVRRVAHGLPHRLDRLRALGNAVVPAQAAHAIRLLMVRATEP